jgi:hypothetical protein
MAGAAFGVRGTILFFAGGSSLLFVAPSAQAVEAAPAAPSPPAAESAPPSPAATPAAREPPPSTPAPELAPPAPEPTPAPAPPAPEPPIAAPLPSNVESADRHDEDADANPGVEDRPQGQQTYAGSITIFSAADLDRTGATGIANLASMTPFMEIGEQEGNLELYVRGVGSSDNAEAAGRAKISRKPFRPRLAPSIGSFPRRPRRNSTCYPSTAKAKIGQEIRTHFSVTWYPATRSSTLARASRMPAESCAWTASSTT